MNKLSICALDEIGTRLHLATTHIEDHLDAELPAHSGLRYLSRITAVASVGEDIRPDQPQRLPDRLVPVERNHNLIHIPQPAENLHSFFNRHEDVTLLPHEEIVCIDNHHKSGAKLFRRLYHPQMTNVERIEPAGYCHRSFLHAASLTTPCAEAQLQGYRIIGGYSKTRAICYYDARLWMTRLTSGCISRYNRKVDRRHTFYMTNREDGPGPRIAVIGLGYVGLPLAEAFSHHFSVVGVDADAVRVEQLQHTHASLHLSITTDHADIAPAEFVIIAVPTPVTRFNEPDLSYICNAAESIGTYLLKGTTVILESTVYPGVTEEVMTPILEACSGLRCGHDFKVAYCPERINPGDQEHTVASSTKVVSGIDDETTGRVAALYGRIAGSVFKAQSIRTAEAAKVIENVQRDLNIALVNELAVIFARMGLDTQAVLEAAATKWNFHPYSPGMVGGHCIPVDPYYLVYKARELGYHPQVILAGRSINDAMPRYVADMTVRGLNEAGKVIRYSRVLVMGLSYKENVPDTRESPSMDLIQELRPYGCEILAWDPLITDPHIPETTKRLATADEIRDFDAVIVTVAHEEFRTLSLESLRARMRRHPVLVDVRRTYDPQEAQRLGFIYKTL